MAAAAADCTEPNALDAPALIEIVDSIHAQNLPIDTLWMDTGWYSPHAVADWYLHAGNWSPRTQSTTVTYRDSGLPQTFPVPLFGDPATVARAAHERGRQFLLWFEPERAVEGSSLVNECPSCFLANPSALRPGDAGYNVSLDSRYTQLLNLGDPSALALASTRFGEMVDRFGVDIFRQDFNVDPLPHWRMRDQSTGEYGGTELRYINGLYRFWDQLRSSRPGLKIESCAAGGRRFDIESGRRAFNYYRSDGRVRWKAGDPPDKLEIWNQGMGFGLSYWWPTFGEQTLIPAATPSALNVYRSRLSPSMVFVHDFSPALSRCRLPATPDHDRAREVLKEYKEIQASLLGDFYPLTDYTGVSSREFASPARWLASQYHRPESDSGVVVAFRRSASPDHEQTYRLSGLHPARSYRIQNGDDGSAVVQTGQALMESGLRVEIPANPGTGTSVLLRYAPVSSR